METTSNPDISKSPNDPNLYRHISLNNGIKAFLISSPKTSTVNTSESVEEKKLQKSTFHHFKEYSKINNVEPKSKHKIDKKAQANEDENDDSDQENEMEVENLGDTIQKFIESNEADLENKAGNDENKSGMSNVVILVETGSGNEPKEFHGIAHLLEHVIFLGCDEFPDQESFSQFISNNGGADNGQTTLDYTLFTFNIENDHLSEALYRFSRLLKHPIFPEDGIIKELKAVNNEFELALSSDGSRNFQILCSNSHPECKYNTFSWGNNSSLNFDSSILREQILKYFYEFYTPEKIKICVFSKLDLNTLQTYVEKNYGDLENKSAAATDNKDDNSNSNTKNLKDDLYRGCYKGMYYIETVKNEHLLFLSWPLKPFFNHYRCRASVPIVNLINEEGPHSLCSLLKKSNLINSICAYTEDQDGLNSLFFLMTIELDLTEQGLEKWSELVSEIFNYLKLMTEEPDVRLYYLNQLKILSEMSFLYADEEHPACMIEKLAFLMTFVDPKELILIYSGLFLDWKKEFYHEILDQLTIDNARITLMSKSECFPKRINLSLVEKWFGTKYYKEDLNEFLIPFIKGLPKSEYNYQWPEENPFLPSKLEVLPAKEEIKIPKIIYNNHSQNQNGIGTSDPKIKCWYYFDSKEMKPKVIMELILLYKSITEGLEDQVNMEFFIEYFMEKFNDSIGHQSFEAEICFEATLFEGKGISFSVYGYFDKIQVFIEKTFNFFTKICNETIEESVFNQIKNRTMKDLKNYILDSESQLQETMNNFLFPDYFLPEQFLEFLTTYQFQNFQEFCSVHLRSFENLFSITSYFHGNIYEETASHIFHSIVNCLKQNLLTKKNLDKGLATKDFLCKKVLSLPAKISDWSQLVVGKALNETNKNLLITRFIDFGKYNLLERNKLTVLLSLLSPQAHEFLRRRRQIGYLANASLSDVRNRMGVCIIVNSSEKNLEEISLEMKNFIEYFLDDYMEKQLTKSEYKQIVNGIIAEKLEVIRDMKLNCARFWGEILMNELLFDRVQRNVEILKKLGLREMKKWIREKLSNEKNSVIVGVLPKESEFPKDNDVWELLKENRKKYFQTFEMDLFHYEFY